jgi:hypothetical protein
MDYNSLSNEMWYFIYPDSPTAYLMVVVTEADGIVYVDMSIL